MPVYRISSLSPAQVGRLLDRRSSLEGVLPRVKRIAEDVRRRGDQALRDYTRRFDRVDLERFRVPPGELRRALEALPERGALEAAARNIQRFHRRQRRAPWRLRFSGVEAGMRYLPLDSAAAYVPRGYLSTALMTLIPMGLAGVPRRVLVSPPGRDGRLDPGVAAAAQLAGATEVYRVGGAQAIAALAYGTRSIPRVDKIVGPGNIYVTAAKMLLRGVAESDLPAGPSEALIIADSTAPPRFVEADLRAQLEHGPDSRAVLVALSPALANRVAQEVPGATVLLAHNLGEALEFANRYAPEHLGLMVRDPRRALAGVRHAGSVFLGPWSPIAAGDYVTGTNHVLPTAGYARAFSGLGVEDFQRRVPWQQATRRGLQSIAEPLASLAAREGMAEHARSAQVRLRSTFR